MLSIVYFLLIKDNSPSVSDEPSTVPSQPPLSAAPIEFIGAGPAIVNVDSALKGYDVIHGDFLTEGDNPGFRNQIFDQRDPNNPGNC